VRVSMLRDAARCCVMLRDAAWCRDAACGVPKSFKWGQVMWMDDWYDWWWLMMIDDDWCGGCFYNQSPKGLEGLPTWPTCF
jgi:hypothetical protein